MSGLVDYTNSSPSLAAASSDKTDDIRQLSLSEPPSGQRHTPPQPLTQQQQVQGEILVKVYGEEDTYAFGVLETLHPLINHFLGLTRVKNLKY